MDRLSRVTDKHKRGADGVTTSLTLTASTGSQGQKGPLVAVPLAGHLYMV